MEYEAFAQIMHRHLYAGERNKLLQKLASSPERFTGLFRSTTPPMKLLQHMTQSREIRFGDAMEEVIDQLIAAAGYDCLDKSIQDPGGERLSVDQYFTDGSTFFFVEQKVRDDHDSTKKRGQTENFRRKLDCLAKRHAPNLKGAMYFIDPHARKNQRYYSDFLASASQDTGVQLSLYYGEELFLNLLGFQDGWNMLVSWLTQWRKGVSESHELDFDQVPGQSHTEIAQVGLSTWAKLIKNDDLWETGLMKTLFSSGETLRRMRDIFLRKDARLAKALDSRLQQFYG
ncbi:MAG: hypothetical protein V2A58_14560 [Planctomycetota bacterium]